MIDYQKLCLAHELVLNLKDYYFLLHFGCEVVEITLCNVDGEPDESLDDIDELIARLQELQPKPPRFKVGQEVWGLHNDGDIVSHIIKRIDPDFHDIYLTFVDDIPFRFSEKDLYISRQELIESQLRYWQALWLEGQILVSNGEGGK